MNRVATEDTDHQLIGEFKRGSMDAMEKIVAKYEERIFNFGIRLCGHLQDAEDIMQETFLNAFKYLDSFREETKLKNWLFKIASSACFRKRRKGKFSPVKEISLESLMPRSESPGSYEIPDWSTNPDEDLLRSELKQVIDSAVLTLPPKYRLVFNLRDIEGFSTEETARILDITSQSVKTRLHRARLFLRKAISGHYKEKKSDA